MSKYFGKSHDKDPTFVFVIGRMRSGGAALAEVLNALGVPMGTRFECPTPLSNRSDWEDAAFSTSLLTNGLNIAGARLYIAQRRAYHNRICKSLGLGDCKMMGVKSPMLLCSTNLELLEAAASSAGFNVVRFVMKRNKAAIDASFERTIGKLSNAHRMRDFQEEIGMRLENKIGRTEFNAADVIEYEKLVADPGAVVNYVAQALGVTDRVRIAEAIRCVREPQTVVAHEPTKKKAAVVMEIGA
jgi:hypothetical protein